MSNRLLAPTTKGHRQPLDNGNPNDRIANPPRFAEMGGLTSPKKIKGDNKMRIKKPGSTEHA